MKIASFQNGGKPSYGVVGDGGIIDLGPRLGDKYPTLRAVLAAGALDEVRNAADGQSADFGVDDVTFLPVIPQPDKIMCVGLNYAAHIKETGREVGDYPTIFTRFANTSVGHLQPMIRPKVSDNFDFEGELAFIVGKAGRHVSEADALDHVAGYTCFNDGSVRDWQFHTGQFTPGKNFVGTGGFGPWMVTTDEIPDPSKLTLTTRLNGEEMQKSGTDQFVFTVPILIAYISKFTELVPGDVVSTGTPGGVGVQRKPPVFMKPGDTIEVEIDKIGTLVNPIVAE